MSDVKASPGRTAALVVGIECYADGQDWEIPGAAADACAFAEWLVDCKVPEDRVLVHLHAKQALGDKVTRHGLPRLDATHAAIHKSMLETVHGWGKKNLIDLLCVYWAGHGFIELDWSRKLNFADSSHDVPRVLALDELLKALRCRPYPRLLVAVVDACADYMELKDEAVRARGGDFVFGRPRMDCRQFLLFSQRPGLPAPNRHGDDPLSFSAVFREALGPAQVPPPRWPPDLPGISDRVKRRFEDLRARGQTSSCPTFHNFGWDGDVTVPRLVLGGVTAAASARAAAVPGEDVEAMATALAGLICSSRSACCWPRG